MGTRQRKIERKRKKRHEKNRSIQSRNLRFEQRAVSDAHALHACIVNEGWEEAGEASIYVARKTSSGRLTTAAFLVDLWGMGLKDAWGNVSATNEEFQHTMANVDEKLGACKLDLLMAKHLVYGGIQLAREVGFRLPRRYERWTGVLGPLPDGVAPDMSHFLKDGKILLTCSERDLKSRLIGTTPENFLTRSDVSYALADGDFTLVDDVEDECQDALQTFEDTMIERAQQSCFDNGEQPHPLLSEIVAASIENTLQSMPEDEDEDTMEPVAESADLDKINDLIYTMLATVADRDPDGLPIAMGQFQRFVENSAGVEEMLSSFPE